MSVETQSDALFTESRRLKDLFEQVIEPHRTGLWQFCRTLTVSPWDAEDLFQETLLKAFATLPQLWNPVVPKSYLFRIATNTWIDVCRKQNRVLDELDGDQIPAPVAPDLTEVREVVELLSVHLPPRQLVVFLLMEVFEFSAREVAGMVHCSEGAAYAALQRARQRIATLKAEMAAPESSAGLAASRVYQPAKVTNAAVEQVIHALNTGDVQAFLGVMGEHIHNDGSPGFQEFSLQEVRDGSGQGLPSGLHASYVTLWGRDVIVVLAETNQGLALHNISAPVVEDNKFVYFRGYYFCKELLLDAARVLDVPLQVKKPAVQWD